MLLSTPCVEVPAKEAQRALQILRNAGLLKQGFKAKKLDSKVRIPVVSCGDAMRLLEGIDGVACCEDVFVGGGRGRTYKDFLRGSIPEDILKTLPSSYDIVGDVVIIKLPDEALSYAELVGGAIAKVVKGVKAVYAAGPVVDEFRVRMLRLIYGEPVRETIMREYGLRIVV
ncbi:MAG: hypothetical protein J7L55_01685, partial [Desulfurococcales archaeon]|nr:hypothetical protein [Desulfurococcales archaeon]